MGSRSQPRSDRRRRRSARGVSENAVFLALLVVVVGAPLALGGAIEPAAVAIQVAVATWALASVVWSHRLPARSATLDIVLSVLALAIVWTALQTLPWPRGVVDRLSPSLGERYVRSYAALGEAVPSFFPPTFDPGGTRAALAHQAMVLAAAIGASIAFAHRGRTALVSAVAASTSVMAAVAAAHALAAADAVFGLYEPQYATPVLLAPLMNSNHLGAFTGMGVVLTLGLAIDSDAPARRAGWIAACVLNAAVCIATLSRGAVVGAAVGLLFFAALALRLRFARAGAGRSSVVVLVAMGVLAVGYFAADRVVEQFFTDDYQKLDVIAAAIALGADHAWVGVGRGAFASAFVARMGSDAYFEYAENLPVQWAAEWGVLVAGAFLVALAWAWARAALKARSWTHVGACAALASIAVHDLVDFALELAGVAVAATALLVAAVAPSRDDRTSRGVRARPLAIGAASGALALVLACAPWTRPNLAREQVERLTVAAAAPTDALDADLRRALLDHPGDPRLVLLAAHRAVREERADALRWLNYSMQLAPHWAGPHLLAAEWLLGQGAMEQAHLEIREAETAQPRAAEDLVCSLLRAGRTGASLLTRAAPGGLQRDRFLDRAARCLPVEDPRAAAIDELVPPESAVVGPTLRRARRARTESPDRALEILRPGLLRPDPDEAAVDLAAEVLLELGRPDEAHALIEAALRREETPTLLARLAAVHAVLGDADSMRAAVVRARARARANPTEVARSYRLLGSLEERMGNLAHALAAYEHAHRLTSDDAALRRVAALAYRLGDRGRAYAAWSELCRRNGPASADCEARSRLERASPEPSVLGTQRTSSP